MPKDHIVECGFWHNQTESFLILLSFFVNTVKESVIDNELLFRAALECGILELRESQLTKGILGLKVSPVDLSTQVVNRRMTVREPTEEHLGLVYFGGLTGWHFHPTDGVCVRVLLPFFVHERQVELANRQIVFGHSLVVEMTRECPFIHGKECLVIRHNPNVPAIAIGSEIVERVNHC